MDTGKQMMHIKINILDKTIMQIIKDLWKEIYITVK